MFYFFEDQNFLYFNKLKKVKLQFVIFTICRVNAYYRNRNSNHVTLLIQRWDVQVQGKTRKICRASWHKKLFLWINETKNYIMNSSPSPLKAKCHSQVWSSLPFLWFNRISNSISDTIQIENQTYWPKCDRGLVMLHVQVMGAGFNCSTRNHS